MEQNQELTLNGSQTSPRLWGWQSILSGLATLLLLAILVSFVNWPSVWAEIIVCQKYYILLGAAHLAGNARTRACRIVHVTDQTFEINRTPIIHPRDNSDDKVFLSKTHAGKHACPL